MILGPLGAISLLWNAILAQCLLANCFLPGHLILGTILIALGALLIALYGLLPNQSTSHDLDQLVYLYSCTPFIVEMLILILTFSGVTEIFRVQTNPNSDATVMSNTHYFDTDGHPFKQMEQEEGKGRNLARRKTNQALSWRADLDL
ncbi:hypothetical protein PCASD_11965 [Puccinia coronata f. sp. avenae]|uniref:Uncharacterized protein n=1 Tax=Puccinia coronata f. sp. avenae TaxID=200324 RepID=A0A2N5UWM0_9BASI|nr:hypothetical protein PCASD_11965 [Puccinia coronata f. sp. avenae]